MRVSAKPTLAGAITWVAPSSFGRRDHLGSTVVVGEEAGAQYLVAGDDVVQRLLQRGQVQRTVQVHHAREGVRLRGAFVELRQEP